MTEDKEHKPEDQEDAFKKLLFKQADWVRMIVLEELAKYEKRKLHEARFGVQYPPKEHK